MSLVCLSQETRGSTSLSQNCPAEKWNDTFAVTSEALLYYGTALKTNYGSAALLHAVYLHNCQVHSRTGVTPLEGWWGAKPKLRYLKLFGTRVCIKRVGNHCSKLDRHVFTGIFLGYTSTDRNIWYLDIDSGLPKTCHHAVFDKTWYLQDSRPPAAELLYQLGLKDKTDATTCSPNKPIDFAPYPPVPPLSHAPLDTAQGCMDNLPL